MFTNYNKYLSKEKNSIKPNELIQKNVENIENMKKQQKEK